MSKVIRHPAEIPLELIERAVAKYKDNAIKNTVGLVEQQGRIVTLAAPVNRKCTPKEALVATGRQRCLDEEVVASCCITAADDFVIMSFYHFGQYISRSKIDGELANLGLELVVDLVGQAAINQEYPDFADTYPNGTQWKNAAGKFCSAIFHRWRGGRNVGVHQNNLDWDRHWGFPVRPTQPK